MKLTKYRRLAAGVALVGAGALALLAGPASAHNWNGNSASPTHPVDGRHDVSIKSDGVEKTVSLVRSKADGCSFNTPAAGHPYGPACATPSIVDVSAPAFAGTPGQGVTAILCNAKRAAPSADGGDDDPVGACDIANARGLSAVPGFPASSGTFTLNASGNLVGSIPLTLTSCNGNTGSLVPDLLTAFGQTTCTNSNATTTCPPTQGQISTGWACIVPLAEFDPSALTAGAHVGFRVFNMKSPIPSKLCNNVACGATIPAGTSVKLTGVRFPCKTTRPDDPAVGGHQGSCLVAWSTKTILLKPSTGSPPLLSVTPTSQTAGLNGDYIITFTLPNNGQPGVLWKMVPHAPTCVFNQGPSSTDPNVPNSCESGNFNAAGVAYKQT